jgi:hypothetical protein
MRLDDEVDVFENELMDFLADDANEYWTEVTNLVLDLYTTTGKVKL